MTKLKTPPALKMTYEVTDEAKMEAYRAVISKDNNKKRRERSLAILERQYKKYLAAKEQAETKKALIHDAERFIDAATSYTELAILCQCIDCAINRIEEAKGFDFAIGVKPIQRVIADLRKAIDKTLDAWLKNMETNRRFMEGASRGYLVEPLINDMVAFCMDGDDRWRFDAIKKKMEELITPDARKERIKETESRLRILYPDAFEADIKYDPEIREASKKAWEYIDS